jgi:spore germination cell wall hydrolase CwlJ-like protein
VVTRRVRREKSLIWLSAALTPWMAGLGLLVSFTASAGTESTVGSGVLGAVDLARIAPALPPDAALIGAAIRRIGEDPLRPEAEPLTARAGTAMLFGDVTGGVSGLFTPGAAVWDAEAEPYDTFTPTADLGLSTGSGSAASTGEGRADLTGETVEDHADGATPAVPKAVALSSTTPAPAESIPVEVAAASLVMPEYPLRTSPEAEVAPLDEPRSRYADLIDPESADKEQRCLSEAVYFEARSESETGQAAVAQVVLNRVKSGLYPQSICGVVYQNRHRYMGCQFSFACEGRSLRVSDTAAWANATRVARAVLEGRTYVAEVGGATHYHADYVRPGWSRRMRKLDVIGRHIFYGLKAGQT